MLNKDIRDFFMDNQYYGVYLRIVSKQGKCVFEARCNKLMEIMAINLAFFRFAYKMDMSDRKSIAVDWNSNFTSDIQDQTILFRWRVEDDLDKKYLYSGIIKVFVSDEPPKTEMLFGDSRLSSINFCEISSRITDRFIRWTGEDWNLGLTLLLFAAQIPSHPFWLE